MRGRQGDPWFYGMLGEPDRRFPRERKAFLGWCTGRENDAKAFIPSLSP